MNESEKEHLEKMQRDISTLKTVSYAQTAIQVGTLAEASAQRRALNEQNSLLEAQGQLLQQQIQKQEYDKLQEEIAVKKLNDWGNLLIQVEQSINKSPIEAAFHFFGNKDKISKFPINASVAEKRDATRLLDREMSIIERLNSETDLLQRVESIINSCSDHLGQYLNYLNSDINSISVSNEIWEKAADNASFEKECQSATDRIEALFNYIFIYRKLLDQSFHSINLEPMEKFIACCLSSSYSKIRDALEGDYTLEKLENRKSETLQLVVEMKYTVSIVESNIRNTISTIQSVARGEVKINSSIIKTVDARWGGTKKVIDDVSGKYALLNANSRYWEGIKHLSTVIDAALCEMKGLGLYGCLIMIPLLFFSLVAILGLLVSISSKFAGKSIETEIAFIFIVLIFAVLHKLFVSYERSRKAKKLADYEEIMNFRVGSILKKRSEDSF